MNPALQAVLEELERFGIENDRVKTEQSERMLNITRDTGEFLRVLIRASHAKSTLEIGTSNGYSTLWLAEATAPFSGVVDTVEKASHKFELARSNFDRSGLAQHIRPHLGDAGTFLKAQKSGSFEFIFLDSKRDEYLAWWSDIRRVLAKGGVLAVDNAISHPHEMADFVAAVKATPGFITALVPVGKGEFLVQKD